MPFLTNFIHIFTRNRTKTFCLWNIVVTGVSQDISSDRFYHSFYIEITRQPPADISLCVARNSTWPTRLCMTFLNFVSNHTLLNKRKQKFISRFKLTRMKWLKKFHDCLTIRVIRVIAVFIIKYLSWPRKSDSVFLNGCYVENFWKKLKRLIFPPSERWTVSVKKYCKVESFSIFMIR